MPSEPGQKYNFPAANLNDFQRLGHPGKFHQSITCTSGTTYFTGSNFGVGGLIVPNGASGTASLSHGGDIPLGTLASSSPYVWEFSLSSVKVDGGTVYALIRNQVIR